MENKNLPELTDEQIIKALECCSQKNTCHECPYNNAFFAQLCLYLLIRDTFALIKRLKSENEELKEYKKGQPVGCPECGRGNFSNDKFCSHCGKQLKGKQKDIKTEVITELLLRAKGLEQIIGEDNELKPYILIEDLNRIASTILSDKERGIE